jgi:hypothetical protein
MMRRAIVFWPFVIILFIALGLLACGSEEPMTELTSPTAGEQMAAAEEFCYGEGGQSGLDDPDMEALCVATFTTGTQQAVDDAIRNGVTSWDADNPGETCLTNDCLTGLLSLVAEDYPDADPTELSIAGQGAYVFGVQWVQEGIAEGRWR